MRPVREETTCPGCGLRMPAGDGALYDGYYNTSPQCWAVYTEVLGAEFGNAVLFGQVHQLTADTYALQHAGGPHPDKSLCVHLCGLHLVLGLGVSPPEVARRLQRIAAAIDEWPHFAPPAARSHLTVCDVALAGSLGEHVECVQEWARSVWGAWSAHHAAVAGLVERYLGMSCST